MNLEDFQYLIFNKLLEFLLVLILQNGVFGSE